MKTSIKFKRYIRNDLSQEKKIIFYSNGDKNWFLNRYYHNENGPAFIGNGKNGIKLWYLDGTGYAEKDYWKVLERHKENKNDALAKTS